MRKSVVSALIVSSMALAGCTSSSGVDGLMMQAGTSAETTGSVVRPSVPVAAAEPAPQQTAPDSPSLAWAGPVPQAAQFNAAPPAVVPQPAQRPQNVVEKPIKVSASQMSAYPVRRLSRETRHKIYAHRFRDAKPINFGKASPLRHPVHGVDVSRWQGNIDWARLRTQGANFAFIKATDGGDHLDPMFMKNWHAADAAGIKRGAYHFFYWCRYASHQADWFIRNVPKDPNALPPVIDVEWNGDSSCKRRLSREQVLEKMQVFMDRLEKHYGKRPIIYTTPDFYRDNLEGAFLDYPFWLRAVKEHPSKVYKGRRWLFWQYSGSGLSHGVNEKIDLNVFYGSEHDWHRWLARVTG